MDEKKHKIEINYDFSLNVNSFGARIILGIVVIAITASALTIYPLYIFQKIAERDEFHLQNTVPTKYYCKVVEMCLSKSNSALDKYLITNDVKFKQRREIIWEQEFKAARDSLLVYTKAWNNTDATSLVYNISVKASRLRDEQDQILREFQADKITSNTTTANTIKPDPIITDIPTEFFDDSPPFDFGADVTTDPTTPPPINTDAKKIEEIKDISLLEDEVLHLIDFLIEIQEEELYYASKQNEHDREKIPYVIVSLFVLIVAIAFLVSTRTIRYINNSLNNLKNTFSELAKGNIPPTMYGTHDETNPLIHHVNTFISHLHALRRFTKDVGGGNFEAQTQAFDGHGDIGEGLKEMKKSLKQVSERDAIRNWSSEGLRQFADILRENTDNMKGLAEGLITHLIKYLKANQGSFYLVDQDDRFERLEMKACYAYDRLKQNKKYIDKGEGIVGEAYQEKRTVYMSEIPQNYFKITSGLGHSTPNYLLIVPIRLNENVSGMIEMASFQPFQKHEIEFVEKVCESTASTLITIENNEKTKKLLESSQMTTEMLRAQEEEMRQNLEELTAMQEEVNRQKFELSSFVNAISLSTIMLEFNQRGTIINVSEKFLENFHYTYDEIVGKPHSFFVPDDVLKSGEFKVLSERMKSNEVFQSDIKRLRKDGEIVWLRAYYIPIMDSTGDLQKFTCLATNITKEIKFREEMDQVKSALEKQTEALNKFIASISNATIMLEYDQEGTIINVSERFCEVLQYDEDEVIGQPRSYFMPEDAEDLGDFEGIWDKLESREFLIRDDKRLKKDKSVIWLRDFYIPIKNEWDQLVKIVCICTDITTEMHMKERIEVMTRQQKSRN
ncbi:MAG: PAS domain-containing protein [Flammeovirgaceae bacterium]